MPIYGYRCPVCDLEFEMTQRMSDPAHGECPACGGAGVRLFFPTGILFKGTGFYKTDSRSAAPAASSSNGDASKPGGTSTETGKPATSKPATESAPAPAPAPTTKSTGSPAKPAATTD